MSSADQPADDPGNGGGPVEHHPAEPAVDDPAKRRTMLRLAAGAGGATVATAGGSQVPQFSPVGRAVADDDCGFGGLGAYCLEETYVGDAVTWLLGGETDQRGASEYERLERLALWADGFRTFASNEATNETLVVTTGDLAEFSVNRLMAEASLAAMNAQHEDGANESEAMAAGLEVIRSEGATMEENILNEAALAATEATNFVGDVEAVAETDPTDVAYNPSHSTSLIAGVTDPKTVEIDLVDGSTWQADTPFLIDDDLSIGIECTWVPEPVISEKDVESEIRYDGTDHATVVDGPLRTFDESTFVLEDFPMDEYENLDEESKENIDPPEDPNSNPPVWTDQFSGAFGDNVHMGIYDAISQAEGEFETFISNIWSDLQADETDPSDFMTPTMLAQTSAEEQTFPYSTSALASMGIPTSAETVEVEFPNKTDDNGDPVVLTGQLFANPMPASGFQKGTEYDPANLDSNIYLAAHATDENNEQMTHMQQVDEPFEIVTAWEINEDGEKVEVDELTWGERGFTGSETNYDELLAALRDVADLEQEATEVQHEIVVELEGDDGGFEWPAWMTPGNWLPDLPFVLIAIVVAAWVVITGD